jgi:hypothetical protein
MNATASEPTAGEPQVLASYECDEGTRQLVGQRINGRVAISDVPIGNRGRVYLVERHLACMAELEGLAAAYAEHAEQLGRPPLRADWILDR